VRAAPRRPVGALGRPLGAVRARPRRAAALGALGIGALALLPVVIGLMPGSGTKASPATTASTATTQIKRQDLVEVESEDGTLGHGGSRAVVNRLSGTITWLPEEGAGVKPDGRLYAVDGSPVILMDGSVPAYRELSPSVSDGPDVAELERNLRALGYDEGKAIELDDSWDAGTTAAVVLWQEAHGLGQTGTIELGRVIFQPGKRRIESIDVTLGGDTGGSGGGTSGSSSDGSSRSDTGGGGSTQTSAASGATAQTRFASYTTSSTEATGHTAQATTTPEENAEEQDDSRELERKERELRRREAALKKREQRLKRQQDEQKRRSAGGGSRGGGNSNGRSGGSASGGGGGGRAAGASAAVVGGGGTSGAAAGGADTVASDGASADRAVSSQVMTTTSTRPVVTVDLDTSKESLAKVGAKVSVDLPSGDTVRGTIASVSKVATSQSSDSQGSDQGSNATEDATVEVTIRLGRRIKALDQAPATVNFEQSRRRDVLAVPVTALLARAGGAYAVEVRDGGERRLVPVTPGLYAGGYVEIEGEGLRPGMTVTDARV
jgi:hypothetical protein